MRTKHYILTALLSVAVAGTVFVGCKKDNSNPPPSNNNNADITPAQDDANGQFAIQDSKNIADGAAKQQAVERCFVSPCATFAYGNHIGKFDTVIGGNNDSALWVNFGSNFCKCIDGNYRKGQLFIYWSAIHHYFDTTGNIGIMFNNYYFNDTLITGSRSLTNNNSKSWTYTAGLSIKYPDNSVASWTGSYTLTYTVVNTVAYWEGSGSSQGTSRTGKSFTLTLNQPLYVTVWPWWLGGCPWIEAGYLTITATGLQYPLSVNYGSATKLGPSDCHINDTIIYNNVKYPFIQ